MQLTKAFLCLAGLLQSLPQCVVNWQFSETSANRCWFLIDPEIYVCACTCTHTPINICTLVIYQSVNHAENRQWRNSMPFNAFTTPPILGILLRSFPPCGTWSLINLRYPEIWSIWCGNIQRRKSQCKEKGGRGKRQLILHSKWYSTFWNSYLHF